VGEKRNANRVLVEKPEGKRPLRRQTWVEDIIKMDLRGVIWVVCVGLINRVVARERLGSSEVHRMSGY
jgi:hypothetical protein